MCAVFGSMALLTLPGCEGPGVLIDALDGPEKVPPVHVLADVPTLVMVDDPQHLLNNPGLSRQIATTAIYYLRFYETLEVADFTDPKELVKLEAQLGDRWESMPIDEVGRRLRAEQVIYARIKSVKIHVADALYRPEAVLEVKLISAADGSRLWPPVQPLADPDHPEPGHPIQIKLDYVSKDSRYVGDSTPDDLARRLADEAGLRLARLFFEWNKPEPGDSL